MSTTEQIKVERDSGDMSVEAFVAGAPIADMIRAVEPRLMPELAPHLLNEVLLSLGLSGCTVDELNLVAQSLVRGLDELDQRRIEARRRQAVQPETSLADFDY